VVFFSHVSSPKPCMDHVLHAMLFIWTSEYYLVRITEHSAPRSVVFSTPQWMEFHAWNLDPENQSLWRMTKRVMIIHTLSPPPPGPTRRPRSLRPRESRRPGWQFRGSILGFEPREAESQLLIARLCTGTLVRPLCLQGNAGRAPFLHKIIPRHSP
jgi:hypothetical protein